MQLMEAYLTIVIYNCKTFLVQATVVNVNKLCFFDNNKNKLQFLSLVSIFSLV